MKKVLRQKINIEDAKAIKVCHDYGHFNHAAEALCITQPTLSTRILNTEDRIGFKIFRQIRPRGKNAGQQWLLQPTKKGEAIIEYCQRLLDFVENNEYKAINVLKCKARRYLSKTIVGAAPQTTPPA